MGWSHSNLSSYQREGDKAEQKKYHWLQGNSHVERKCAIPGPCTFHLQAQCLQVNRFPFPAPPFWSYLPSKPCLRWQVSTSLGHHPSTAPPTGSHGSGLCSLAPLANPRGPAHLYHSCLCHRILAWAALHTAQFYLFPTLSSSGSLP